MGRDGESLERKVIELWYKSNSDINVAKELGITPQKVKAVRRKYNIAKNKKTSIVRDKYLGARLRKLHKSGLSDKEIAEATGLSLEYINTWRNRKHLCSSKQYIVVSRSEEIDALYNQGLVDDAIAKELGMGRATVWSWRLLNGKPPNGKNRKAKRQ